LLIINKLIMTNLPPVAQQ